jgi:FAD/FMN-containing dehydrogenase
MLEKMKALIQHLGPEQVSDDASQLAVYAWDNSFGAVQSPQAVVKVRNVGDVEFLINWANQTKTPLIPVSSQGPHYRGDTVPRAADAVMVDLSGMKKVLSINRTHRMALIEPGVTYEELLKALEPEGMTVAMPLAPKAGKSVVGSLLETEPRLNALHQWCNLDPLRCVEVTWGDGNRMFTGEAGGSVMDLEQQWKEEKWQWEPFGPMMLDFYRLLTGAQGSMGIVTWASVRCEIMPQAHPGFLVPAAKLEDLVDFAYAVLRLRFSEEFFIMNGRQLACLLARNAAEIAALQARLPAWVAVVGIVGREILPEERVAAQQADIADIAGKYGLQLLPEVAGITGEAVLAKAGQPSAGTYWKETAKGAFADLFFATTLDRTPAFISKMNELAAQAGYPATDIGVYLQPENMGTSYHCSFTLPYDPKQAADTKLAGSLFQEASAAFCDMGAYYFRPYGIWSQLQLGKDAQSFKIQKRLKEIFDPNGILNPGTLYG